MVQGRFGKANINASIFLDYGLHTASTRGMTVLNRNYSDSPSTNGGATRAAGGAPVIRPSEISPAPCHPKAQDTPCIVIRYPKLRCIRYKIHQLRQAYS